MSDLFLRRDVEQYTDSLAAYLPGGELFTSKSIKDSNFRKLLTGMAGELFRANGLLREYSCEIIPDQTNKFLSEWESTLGIPDDCFSGTGSNDDRRRDILVKLAALGVQTAQDFVDLGAAFGVTVTVRGGIDEITFPLTFPIVMFTTKTEARFTIVVRFTVQAANRFPLVFPITFGSGEIAILECLFTKLKPANCNIIFQQV
jgi:uncharacterized protein YmfQ (DUF2313 family)